MKKICLLFIAICIGAIMLCACSEKKNANTSEKKITVNVVDDKGNTTPFVITTSTSNLGDAMRSIDLVQGEEGQYGLYIKTVNGITVDDSKEQWWCVTKGGESVMTGVDDTPIANGDIFEITFTTGY